MKKIFFCFFAMINFAFLISSCSKSKSEIVSSLGPTHLVQESTSPTFPSLIFQIPTGSISGEMTLPSSEEISDYLLANNYFEVVSSLSFEYEFDSLNKKYDAFITLIGESGGNTVSFQFTLLVDIVSRSVFFQYPKYELGSTTNTINVHECNGSNCSSCAFLRKNGTKGRIVGCTCSSSAGGSCNHSMKGGIDINNVIELAAKLIGLFGK